MSDATVCECGKPAWAGGKCVQGEAHWSILYERLLAEVQPLRERVAALEAENARLRAEAETRAHRYRLHCEVEGCAALAEASSLRCPAHREVATP